MRVLCYVLLLALTFSLGILVGNFFHLLHCVVGSVGEREQLTATQDLEVMMTSEIFPTTVDEVVEYSQILLYSYLALFSATVSVSVGKASTL